ncbi:leucine rich repeat protein [Drechmeria coniospora]|uniref:Leucine rich repeat protein n=1 Tax=Drechmeria coniospora TaxID=98403 RepID=A0A151GL40_DRECN|nr:leucine rich repeat protein [Drechmeria coniospora]KYK57827.1 leucine rich repeat protein [Drechmeria coniospora]
MSIEKWKWRSSSSLVITPSASYQQHEPDKMPSTKSAESKAPRGFTRALRSLSGSSADSVAGGSLRSCSTRKLRKSPSFSGSVIGRLHCRVSKDLGSLVPSSNVPGYLGDGPRPYRTMDLVHHGPLKADVSLLKARSEYLVLSDQCLVKFASADAARGAFPQLSQPNGACREHHRYRVSTADVRLEIPLRSIVAAFDEDSAGHGSAIDITWFSRWPRLAHCKALLCFSLPEERDDWLLAIHRASRARHRKSPAEPLMSENLRTRINHIVRSAEGIDASQSLIFPVARRVSAQAQKASAVDAPHLSTDQTSFYMAIGPCMCHFIEVLKAEHSTLPGDLRVKAMSYGTITLAKFKASVASHEHRFVMCFRPPFGRETRLDLASIQYRRIIEALIKVDRNLKPLWPQSLQRVIFDVKGLPPPLQLTKGNDLGGLESSLQAYCSAFRVPLPEWKIEWSTPPYPAFRLLPPQGSSYSALQLVAVFRALRYNSFFKAVSFKDVDMSALVGKNDHSPYGDGVAFRSLSTMTISEDYYAILLQAPILEQEIHALVFASESIRSVDVTNVFGLQGGNRKLSRAQCDLDSLRAMSSEMLRPILMLWSLQMCVCQAISMSGNPLALGDVDELANLLTVDHVHLKKLHLAKCALGDASLSKLWTGLAGQGRSLESLDTSDNQGIVRFDIMQGTLKKLARLTSLNVAGNTRITTDESLLDRKTLEGWHLRDLDLSGITLNDATVDDLAAYLAMGNSRDLQVVRLDSCGLNGRHIARLFRAMGQARRLTMHLNGNGVDEGIDDLCEAISCSYGPWGLFLQMVEFASEANYVKLWRALTANMAIQCLSLAGTSTPDAASSTACQAVSGFFEKNDTVRFLDISGYDSKLDEGRLGREFSNALGGIRHNTRIEHLRVRSQMLNINVGDLAEAISGNTTLHTLDCEANDFNLSNFRHIIKHLETNTTIRSFSAFSDAELSDTIRKSVRSTGRASPTRRSSVISRFRTDRTQNAPAPSLVHKLKGEWDAAAADLELVLERNQQLFVQLEEETSKDESLVRMRRRDSDVETVFSTAFGGLAHRDLERRTGKGPHESACARKRTDSISTHPSAPDGHGRVTRSSSTVSSDTATSPSTDGFGGAYSTD